jgi:hypothetical protein
MLVFFVACCSRKTAAHFFASHAGFLYRMLFSKNRCALFRSML